MGVLQQREKRICPRTSKVCDPHHIRTDLPFEGTSAIGKPSWAFPEMGLRLPEPCSQSQPFDVVAERGFRTGHGEITDKRAICHTHYGGWKVRITPDALLMLLRV